MKNFYKVFLRVSLLSMTICFPVFAGTSAAAEELIRTGNQPPVSPAWVFDHWVWEDDENTEAALWELIDGYESRGIPVGAVVIDSPWSTEYNNFIWNREQYPDPEGMMKRLTDRGIRVILWYTSMLNVENPGGKYEPKSNSIYQEAKEKGYLCNGGETYKWWKGKGAFIDYTNPEARAWWHGLLDRVLDLGVDGWKADGTDPMFPAGGRCMAGPIGPKEYKDLYYGYSYEYIKSKNPEGVSWGRAVDLLFANPKGFAPVSHSAVNWVGDEQHSWAMDGFLEAIQDIFDSARLGYTVVGSDIAGYHGGMEVGKRLLLRWAQFGAMCPLMENGGHGAHQPWRHDEETVNVYRKFVKLHLALQPYLYSMMMKGHEMKGSIIHPQKGTWQYKLGDDLFVAAIYDESDTREITFPAGEWRDWWTPSKVYKEGETITYNTPLDRYPLFVRAGSIIPLYVKDPELGMGDASFAQRLTLDVYPGGGAKSVLCEEGRERNYAKLAMDGEKNFTISISGAGREIMFRVLGDKPSGVLINGAEIKGVEKLDGLGNMPGAWYHDPVAGRTFINPGASGEYTLRVKY